VVVAAVLPDLPTGPRALDPAMNVRADVPFTKTATDPPAPNVNPDRKF